MKDIFHGTVSAYANDKCRCASCKESWAEYMRRLRTDKARAKRYKAAYGLEMDEFFAILLRQGNRCGICKRDRDDLERDFFVDHDHETGKVRGLLCIPCNTGLGLLGDSIDGLLNGLDYLRKVSQSSPFVPNSCSIDEDLAPNQVELVREERIVVRIGPS